jgi:hypothetical protein
MEPNTTGHHIVKYNNRTVIMNYVLPKEEFKYGRMRISDNLGTGKDSTQEGYIITPDNKVYLITRSSRKAKLITD